MKTYENETTFLQRCSCGRTMQDLDQSRAFKPRKLLLQWHITDACNLACRHCYQPEKHISESLTVEQLGIVLSKYLSLLRRWNITGHINFTGGEPLMRDDFLLLLEKVAVHKEMCSFAVLSNGSLLDNTNAKYLKKLDCRFFQISLEGTCRTHDRIRGDGNFDVCIQALRCLHHNRIPSMVSFTASRLNAAEFHDVARICRKNKVHVVWSDRMLPLGNGIGLHDELLQPDEVAEHFENMMAVRRSFKRNPFNRTEIRMHRALNHLVLAKHHDMQYRPYQCRAGSSLLTVLANGDIVPCRRMPIVVGNALMDDLHSVYTESATLRLLRARENIPAECTSCMNVKTCRGGLRCLSYAYHGDPFTADPQCYLLHTTLPSRKNEHKEPVWKTSS